MLTRVGVPVESGTGQPEPSQAPSTLICFSHLRWDFVFQRPQHLMSRFAKAMPVVIWEEPVDAAPGEGPSLDVRPAKDCANVTVVTPQLPEGLDVDAGHAGRGRVGDEQGEDRGVLADAAGERAAAEQHGEEEGGEGAHRGTSYAPPHRGRGPISLDRWTSGPDGTRSRSSRPAAAPRR